MPKDKKSKEKEGSSSCSKEVELVVKRKNSVVESSSGGSSYSSSTSAAASDNSGNSSDNSGDSDGFDNEKGTMTGENGQGTSAGCCSVDIRDRTEEMRRIMNENTKAEKKAVRVINDQNTVPITEGTHLVPISNESGDKRDSESPTSSVESSTAKKPTAPAVNLPNKQVQSSKNQKQKQLTKKQRKEMERKKAEDAGESLPQFPGQKERVKKLPIEQIVNDRPNLHLHQFNEWPVDQENRCITVRGRQKNRPLRDAQHSDLNIVRGDKELGPEMSFTDLHRHSQTRYLRYSSTIANYTSAPANLKLVHRMGYGVSGSGVFDPDTRLLTIKGSNQFMRYGYQDYVKSGSKIHNWRQEFNANADMDKMCTDHNYVDITRTLKSSVDNIIETCHDDFYKKIMLTLRDGTLRTLVLQFGEMDRQLMRHKNDVSDVAFDLNMDGKTRKERFVFLKAEVFSLCSREFVERTADNQYVNRSVSILHYLSARCKDELPCYEQEHRKCSMMHFLLSNAAHGDKKKQLMQQYYGGNTLLHMAGMTGAPCQIDVLLRQGAPLNALNDHFRTPLSLALRRHSTLVARQFLWHGADLGGSMSLTHILPKNPIETRNKQMSEYIEENARAISYKAGQFMLQRQRALNNTFTSWVESLIIEAETRFALGVGSVKSSLHEVRIGPMIDDPIVHVSGNHYVKKSVRIALERTAHPRPDHFGRRSHSPGQIVLFLIPCQYTDTDTTMPANFPYVLRMPMIHNVEKVIAAGTEGCLPEEVSDLKPIKLLSQPPSIQIGDGASSRLEVLESFFSIEHNGLIYAYNLPNFVTKTSAEHTTQPEYSHFTVHLTVSEKEANAFQNCFFMVQAMEVIYRQPPTPMVQSFQGRDAEARADERVLDMVTQIKNGVAQKREEREREAKLITAAAAAAVADARANNTILVNGIERKRNGECFEPTVTFTSSTSNFPRGAHSNGTSDGATGNSNGHPASPSKLLPKTKTE